MALLINTPLQRGDGRWGWRENRFNGFDSLLETVETVPLSSAARYTPLKRAVNEIPRRTGELVMKYPGQVPHWKRFCNVSETFSQKKLERRLGFC